MQTGIAHSTIKYTTSSDVPGTTSPYKLYMAGNEAEGCQIVLRSETEEHITLQCSGEGLICSVFLEHTLQAAGENYPDPLTPVTGAFVLPADTTTVLYIRFTAEKSTAAGEYPYTITLSDGTESRKCEILVHVWDFVLPDTSACATAVGIWKQSIARFHKTEDPEKIEALYRKYYELLLAHKMSPYDIPYDLLDDRADVYLNDPRMTSFTVPCCEDDDARLVKIYEKLSSNPMWLAKACFYPVDEPSSMELLEKLAAYSERLQRLAPGIRICTPYYSNIQVSDEQDQTIYMTGKTTLWCPQSPLFVTKNFYTPYQWEHYPEYPARMMERKAAGDGLWWYVCWGPREPYCNLFIDQQSIKHRILFWQQYFQKVDGFLYWAANYWENTDDPWTDMATVKFLSPEVFGDGSLVYPGTTVGIDGVCSSLRLETLQDGVEDFDYLMLAEAKFGREWVLDVLYSVTTGMTEYTMDHDVFAMARQKIGCALAGE